MVKDDMQDEIDELRAQVAELKAEREAKVKEQAKASSRQPSAEDAATQSSTTSKPTQEESVSADTEASDLSSMFQELIDTIDEELKAANPLTVLVVFALGVLVGRLLPR